MNNELSEDFDTQRLEGLPQLSLAEAAWMAGITPDAFEQFLGAISLSHLRHVPITELVRAAFTLLGQREAQVAMFRLQLATALQREQELTEALHSKLTAGSAEFFMPQTPSRSAPSPSTSPLSPVSHKKSKKRKKKK